MSPPCASAAAPLPECAAFDALGDAVAWLDSVQGRIVHSTRAWRARHAGVAAGPLVQALADALAAAGPAGTDLRTLVLHWPADADADADADVNAGDAGGSAPRPLTATLRAAPALWLLRAAPAPIDPLAAMHHLQDRERLLFTSRSVSVGEMASTLAHEINQPIGTIANVLRGVATRLERLPGIDAPALADIAQGLRLAQEQAQFAARIVGRIREYTQSRQPRRETLEMGALARECVALLDWAFARHGVPLACETGAPAWVQGDPVMLQQVLVNLLRNALDAQRMAEAPAGGRVRLTVHGGDGPEVEVAIADNGCGISREAEDQLFVPFQSSKPDGMGIGLKICRSFVELHQGRLWFTRNAPADGGGCTFHIALRRAPAPA